MRSARPGRRHPRADQAAHRTPDAVADGGPHTFSDESPDDEAADRSPDGSPDGGPDAFPDAGSDDDVADRVPDDVAHPVPDDVADRVPDDVTNPVPDDVANGGSHAFPDRGHVSASEGSVLRSGLASGERGASPEAVEVASIAPRSGPTRARPRRRDDVREVESRAGLALYAPAAERPVLLDPSAREVWERCDGSLGVFDIAETLGGDYACDEIRLAVDVTGTVAALQRLGLVEIPAGRRPVKLVMGVEDTVYFHWQLPILFESLLGQLPDGWEIVVVVCNDHARLSHRLLESFRRYGVRFHTGRSRPDSENMDFAGGGDRYVPINRVEALNVVARHVRDEDLVFLLDTDNFLFRELDLSIFPDGNALCANWIVGKDRFFEHVDGVEGVDLHKLLEAIGCSQAFAGGGVSVFLEGRTLRREKVVQDCFRFAQIVYLMGKVAGDCDVWVSEMPCFALALTANRIPYEVIDYAPFLIDKKEKIPPGTFYHYYVDIGDGHPDGAFFGSEWCKQRHYHDDLLEADLDRLRDTSATDHERYFFELAQRARLRLGKSGVSR